MKTIIAELLFPFHDRSSSVPEWLNLSKSKLIYRLNCKKNKKQKNTKQKQKQKQNEGIEEEKDKYDIQSFSRLVDALGCF